MGSCCGKFHEDIRWPKYWNFSNTFFWGPCFIPWVLVHTRPCMCPPRVEFLFPPVLWNSCNQASLAFKARFSGASSSCCQTSRQGSLTWGSIFSLLWESFCGIIISSLWTAHLVVWDLILSQLHPSYHFVVAEKDLSSPPLVKTPKSQLTAEQSSTKKTGTYQNKYFTFKDQE